jgi:hypothetical protein
MPKPEKPEEVTLNGKPAARLVKVVKPARQDRPDIANEMTTLAAETKAQRG